MSDQRPLMSGGAPAPYDQQGYPAPQPYPQQDAYGQQYPAPTPYDPNQQQQYPPQGYPPQQPPPQQYPPQGGQGYPGPAGGAYPQGGPGAQPVMGVQDCINSMHASLAAQKLVIKQQVSVLEAAADTIGCCEACCEQPNKYDVFDAYTGAHVLSAQEESEFLMRCCCNPHHELKLHLTNPQTQQRVATVNRPFKCAGICPVWFSCCQSEAMLHAGTDVENPATLIGKTQQPCCGGICTPTVKAALGQNEPSENHFAVLQGPQCFFGGLTEMCCDQPFTVSSTDDGSGDLAMVVKEKPEGMQQMATELLTDSDLYTLTFKNPSLGPDQRLTLISSVLLLDYMFFDSNQPFECNPIDQSCAVTCCNAYFCGATIPCTCKCGGQNAQDDSN